MWAQFAFAVLVELFALYVPGFLTLRAAGFSRFASAVCAPLIFVAFANVLYIVYAKAGVSSSWLTVEVPLTICALIAYAIMRLRRRGIDDLIDFGCPEKTPASKKFPFITVNMVGTALYIACGVVAVAVLYLAGLDGPGAYIQSFDNVHHLGSIRAFAESGDYSSLGASMYRAEDAMLDPLADGGFYPSAWHALAATVVEVVSCSISLSATATNVTLITFVMPMGMFAFLRIIAGPNRRVALLGAPLALANASLPWMMLTWGPLYPNVMAFCLLPAAMFCFVGATAHGMSGRTLGRGVALFAIGMVAILFAQPNGLFTAGVLLAPYCVYRVFQKASYRGKKFAWCMAGIAVAAIAAAWTAVYFSPLMRGVVDFHWDPVTSVSGAIEQTVSLAFRVGGHQYAGGVLMAIGIAYTIRRRRYFWLTCSFLFAGIIYIASVSDDGFVQHFLSGFWYCDAPRVAATAAFAVYPLEALGLGWIVNSLSKLIEARVSTGLIAESADAKAAGSRVRKATPRWGVIATTLLACVVYALVWFPWGNDWFDDEGGVHHWEENPIWGQARHIQGEYDYRHSTTFDEAEQIFVEQIHTMIPADAVIINEPNDGSAYLYGVYGLRTYNRYWRTYGVEEEAPESVLFRTKLDQIANDEAVQEAAERVGAAYVIQLDKGHDDFVNRFWTYGDGSIWRGIDDVDDSTPGFEVVLSEDDMRLYKIVL